MDFWREVGKLTGRTLYTLDQSKPFDVVAVSESELEIHLHSTDKFRKIRREPLEKAWAELVRRGAVSRADIRNKYSNFNPAYVAAILAALPGVEFSVGPITLRVQKER